MKRASALLGCAVLFIGGCGPSKSDPIPEGSAGSTTVGTAGAAGSPNAGGAPEGGSSGGLPGSGGTAAIVGGSGGNVGGSGGGATIANCKPPADVFSPIDTLSKTGCVDSSDPRKFVPGAIAYEVNSPLWSDQADKARAFVLPAGTKIHVRNCSTTASDCPMGMSDDGRWDFPVGTVLIKTFSFDSKLVETRLFMHLNGDNWVGYGYQWDEAQTDAKLITDRTTVTFNTGTRSVPWTYPSQEDCMKCHNQAGGSSLGPETAQMNRTVGSDNQIDHFAALGLFETAPVKPYKTALVAPYPNQLGTPPASATLEQKARSYLHANCAFCHRPGGTFALFDLRYDTPLKDTKICNATIDKPPIPSAPDKTLEMKPGSSADSVMWLRMKELDPTRGRMPQIGTNVSDTDGVALVGSWIDSLTNADCNR